MNLIELALLITFSFIPPIIYVIWIRNTEKYNVESWKPITVCFLWGATIAIVVSIILEIGLGITLALSIRDTNAFMLTSAVIIAPFAEELTKPLALNLRSVRKELDELEDGFIYGAAAGLGFAATENLLYGSYFISQGLLIFLVLIILRSTASCLLHASATAFTGYGYARSLIEKTPLVKVIPYFILAMFLHGLFNFFLSFEMIGLVFGLILAFLLVAVSIYYIRKKIQVFDLKNHMEA